MAVTTTQVQQLYLAYFGRPAEQAGLTYWTAQANANLTDVSAAFAQQQEYTSVYGGLTRSQTIDTLYQNLFNRSAASNELNYWLNSTDVSISNLALALTNGATGTDRLVLDTKAQYAATVTANAGASASSSSVASTYTTAATTSTVVNGTTYTSLANYLAASSSNNAAAFYAAANTAAKAAVAPVLTDASAASVNVSFGGLTAGTVALNSLGGTHEVVLPATGNLVTSLSINGTVDGLNGTTAAASVVNITETPSSGTDIVTSLNVNVSSSATGSTPAGLTLGVSTLSALTSIDASASSTGLTIAAGALDSLTSLKTGSGADVVTVNTALEAGSTLTAASALTVDTGAGNDTVNGTAGTAALTINSGAGVDTLNLVTTGQAALTVNAGAGNDVVNLSATATAGVTAAHVTSITLGDGNDTLNVTSLANLNGTFTTGTAAQITAANTAIAEDLVKVTDFSGTQDKMVVTVGSASLVTLDNTQLGTVQNAATLAEAVASAANIIAGATPAAHSTSFVYGGNTYVFVDAGSGNLGTVGNGDGLIELTGYTGTLTSANFATA